ncbi:hypothetical protein N7536_011709 [Penicillium majusculum]|nr:hypothetical protein N7536_011709 [Penicillium majusculum]
MDVPIQVLTNSASESTRIIKATLSFAAKYRERSRLTRQKGRRNIQFKSTAKLQFNLRTSKAFVNISRRDGRNYPELH